MGPDHHYTRRFRSLPYFGTREQVFCGQARYTKGFLRREHLVRNCRGRIVSVKAQAAARHSSHLPSCSMT